MERDGLICSNYEVIYKWGGIKWSTSVNATGSSDAELKARRVINSLGRNNFEIIHIQKV